MRAPEQELVEAENPIFERRAGTPDSRWSRKAFRLLDVDKNFAPALVSVDTDGDRVPKEGLNAQAERVGLTPDIDNEFGLSDGEREKLISF